MKKIYTLYKKAIGLVAILFLSFLQAKAYDVTVAKDGSGNFTTVQAAIDAAPTGRTTAYTIFIKNGKYREKNNIPSTKPFIQLVGESVANVFIYYDDPATILGTQNSASFTVGANDFSAFNITFANTFGDGSQAVAILVNADRAAFKNCRFLGNQDTIYLKGSGTPRNYFKNCYIDGNVDFIFGSAVALFDSCVVFAKSRTSTSSSYITAPNTPTGQAYGFVFRNTALPNNTGGTSYFLSRPWPSPSEALTAQKAVFLSCQLSSHIQPTGWSTWDANTITANLYYGEYKSKYFNGNTVDISQRVSWSKQLTQTDSSTYTFTNLFGTWDPCTVATGFCTGAPREIAVSNFRGAKVASTSNFNWNISWPMAGIQYDLYRSSNNVSFAIVNTQTAVSDTAIHFNYSEAVPPSGQTYYYYIRASKAGFNPQITDTISISSTPTVSVTGSTGSFLQGLGTPSSAQSYIVGGTNLTDNIIITSPANYEISSNSGTSWNNSSTPIVLTQTSGTLANTTILVRLNATAVGPYSGNITHTSTGAASVNLAVSGTVQAAPLTVSSLLEQWPLTTANTDSSSVRAAGVVATVPTLNKLYVSNGTTVSGVTAYSPTYGQSFGATSNGDGSWGTAAGGPGGNLNRTFYEQFTITAASTHSLRVDSLILSSSFYNTSSNTKLAVVYSLSGFTTADSTDVTGGIGSDGLSMASSANGAFATPVILVNETAGTTSTFRFALANAAGVTVPSGQTLTIRLYMSCGSTSAGRYGKIKNVYAKGLSTINPVIGDYRSHQSGDWTDLATWERWDGTVWATPAPAYPVYNNSGTTNILNGHTVSVSANLANGSGYIHLTKVNQGGQMVVGSGVTLNLANDGSPSTATTDLQVDGTLTQTGNIGTNGNVSVVVNGTYVATGTLNLTNTGDSLIINTGGTYQHNVNSGSTPTNIKGLPGSTFLVTGITTNQTNIFKAASTYGNIVWNCPSQANYYAFRNNLTATNVSGSFTVASTGSTYISFANTSCNINFPGGYYQTGGTVNYRENSTITDTLTLGGDFSVTGGSFISNFGTGTSLLVRLNGTNKTINYTQATATNTYWNVSGIYTLAGNLTLPNSTFGLTVGGTLNTGTYTVNGSGDFILSPSATLSSAATTGLNGNITVSGTKTLGTTSNYIFNGTAAQVTGALVPATVNSLTVNNATGVSLSSPVAIVGGVLALTSGKLSLGVNNLSTSSITGASTSNYIVTDGTGALKLNNIGAGANLFPVGLSATSYNPLTINNAGTVDNFSVNVKNAFTNPFPITNRVVNTNWNITEDVIGGSNATLGLSWILADQAAAFNPNTNLNVMRYASTAWSPTAATLSGAGTVANPYYATAAGFTSFSSFAVANIEALPLNLLSFAAGFDKNEVKVLWNTSNEVNTASFIIERSADGITFTALGTVLAKNTVNNSYTFTDVNPINGIGYYRLKMLDKDALFKYSKVVTVNSKLKNTITVYPNPASSFLTLTHDKAKANTIVDICLIDGRKLSTHQVLENATQTSIDISKLPAGNYLLIIINGQEKTTVPFIKQ